LSHDQECHLSSKQPGQSLAMSHWLEGECQARSPFRKPVAAARPLLDGILGSIGYRLSTRLTGRTARFSMLPVAIGPGSPESPKRP
jgi:hypothetical protein